MAALSSLITPTNIITAENTLTLTNKTISGASNTLTNIPLSSAVTGTLAVANGGTGGTTQATARTGLGATTVGGNLFTLTNPSAVTFPRFNADNTVSALDAATFRSAIGAGTGSGTVTSVGATAGTGISISGSPITSSGSLTITNTGVTSLAAGSGISVSGSTGGVTVTNSGVTSVTAGTGISVSASTGGVTISASSSSSFVFLGRATLSNASQYGTVNLPANWQNTYDCLMFTVRGVVFFSGSTVGPGYIIANNTYSFGRYNISYGQGGSSNQAGNASAWNILGTCTSGVSAYANGWVNYSGSGYHTSLQMFNQCGGTNGGWVTGIYDNNYVSGAITSLAWYNGGYNLSDFYLTGSFTVWGVKNS